MDNNYRGSLVTLTKYTINQVMFLLSQQQTQTCCTFGQYIINAVTAALQIQISLSLLLLCRVCIFAPLITSNLRSLALGGAIRVPSQLDTPVGGSLPDLDRNRGAIDQEESDIEEDGIRGKGEAMFPHAFPPILPTLSLHPSPQQLKEGSIQQDCRVRSKFSK